MLVDLSLSQIMALGTILGDELLRPEHTEIYYDASTGVETRPEDLLRVFVNLGSGLHQWPTESDRQLLLLALALTALARPGFDDPLRRIAAQLRGGPGRDGTAMYENFKRLNSDPPPLFVGTLVTVDKASGVNEAGAIAVVVEEYQLAGRIGWTLLFEDGRHDGFSPEDCETFGVRSVLVDTAIGEYEFVSATRLRADYLRGVFDASFASARTCLEVGIGGVRPIGTVGRGTSFYPPGWPRCRCGEPVLDGHLTCGRVECNEAGARAAARTAFRVVPPPADDARPFPCECGEPLAPGCLTCGRKACAERLVAEITARNEADARARNKEGS